MVLPSDKWSINTSLLEVFLSTSSAEYRIQVGHPGDYGTLHILYVCKLIQPMAAIRNKKHLSRNKEQMTTLITRRADGRIMTSVIVYRYKKIYPKSNHQFTANKRFFCR